MKNCTNIRSKGDKQKAKGYFIQDRLKYEAFSDFQLRVFDTVIT